jgi:hypothetical protein
MATFLVTYDLRGTDETSDDYKRLIEKIKSYSTWARPTYSDWIVVTTKSAAQVRDELWAYMDSNDRLLVAAIGAPAAWNGSIANDVSDWMKTNLK